MRIHQQPFEDLERIIEFDFVRATESAALTLSRGSGGAKRKKQTLPPATRSEECSI